MWAPQQTWITSLGWEDALEEEIAVHSSIPAWRNHGQRSLVSYSPQGHKELCMTEESQACRKKENTYIQNEVYFMKEYLEESEKGTREKQDSGRRGNN